MCGAVTRDVRHVVSRGAHCSDDASRAAALRPPICNCIARHQPTLLNSRASLQVRAVAHVVTVTHYALMHMDSPLAGASPRQLSITGPSRDGAAAAKPPALQSVSTSSSGMLWPNERNVEEWASLDMIDSDLKKRVTSIQVRYR